MIRAATHGLAAWGHGGSKHHTYNHSKTVDPDKRPHRALNIKKNGSKQSKDLMGKREAINIHVSQNWKWSDACFLPVPTGMIAYDELNKDQIIERNKAAGLPKERYKEGYIVENKGLPYWNGQATLDLMNELIKIVEDFARETNQLDGRGQLPLNTLLKCVEVIIREPKKGDYDIKYMNSGRTGSYVEPQSSGK